MDDGNKSCCVAECGNSQRHPDLIKAESHVEHIKWHRVPRGTSVKNVLLRKQWIDLIKKGKKSFHPGNETFVCYNHFVDGEPTQSHPYPTLFLRSATSTERKPPKERKPLVDKQLTMEIDVPDSCRPMSISSVPSVSIRSAMKFSHLTREADVRFYTGLSGTTHFRTLFQYVEEKASRIRAPPDNFSACPWTWHGTLRKMPY